MIVAKASEYISPWYQYSQIVQMENNVTLPSYERYVYIGIPPYIPVKSEDVGNTPKFHG